MGLGQEKTIREASSDPSGEINSVVPVPVEVAPSAGIA
jgi:hypothetical protein